MSIFLLYTLLSLKTFRQSIHATFLLFLQILDVTSADVITKKLPKPPQKTVIIDECGHCIHIEHPRQLMSHVIEMIESFAN